MQQKKNSAITNKDATLTSDANVTHSTNIFIIKTINISPPITAKHSLKNNLRPRLIGSLVKKYSIILWETLKDRKKLRTITKKDTEISTSFSVTVPSRNIATKEIRPQTPRKKKSILRKIIMFSFSLKEETIWSTDNCSIAIHRLGIPPHLLPQLLTRPLPRVMHQEACSI